MSFSLPRFYQQYHMHIHHKSANMTTTSGSMNLLSRTLWSGLMVGDALGAPVEFNYAVDIRKRFPEGLDRMIEGFGICTDRRLGVVTDDTQMSWCLHQSLLDADGWSPAAAWARYQEWLATDPADVGDATKEALLGNPQQDAQGNGALMRVMPLALWAAQHPGFDWVTAAREDAALTPPAPREWGLQCGVRVRPPACHERWHEPAGDLYLHSFLGRGAGDSAGGYRYAPPRCYGTPGLRW